MNQKILIFIITYKASFRIIDVIEKIPFGYIKKLNYEVYISDDNSNDDTLTYIENIKKKYPEIVFKLNHKNIGYGGNIKRCLRYAFDNKFDYAIMLHGDDQYNAKYIKDMIESFKLNKDTAAVSGSRMKNKLEAIKGNMPIYKFLGNIFLTKFFNFIYSTNFSDCHSGYWIYNLSYIKKDLINNLTSAINFDSQMRISLVKNNLKIGEIPIKTIYGSERSSVHLVYALKFFFESVIKKFT